ncbi:MAG: aminoacyl-tRNA hydrolase [Candidatus Moraniibacteriota bacterium]
MKLIVGLGNPGTEYQDTRHNAGFLALDFLQTAWESPAFLSEQKLVSSQSVARFGTEKLLLLKPETFMNDSGTAVRKALQYYKIGPEDLLVVHDDMDIPSGQWRFTESSRSAGHNGVESLIEALGTQDFARLRLGIGRPEATLGACQPSHTYVLGILSEKERLALASLFPQIQGEIESWIKLSQEN